MYPEIMGYWKWEPSNSCHGRIRQEVEEGKESQAMASSLLRPSTLDITDKKWEKVQILLTPCPGQTQVIWHLWLKQLTFKKKNTVMLLHITNFIANYVTNVNLYLEQEVKRYYKWFFKSYQILQTSRN